jgi:hypothetical protein
MSAIGELDALALKRSAHRGNSVLPDAAPLALEVYHRRKAQADSDPHQKHYCHRDHQHIFGERHSGKRDRKHIPHAGTGNVETPTQRENDTDRPECEHDNGRNVRDRHRAGDERMRLMRRTSLVTLSVARS